MMMKDIRAKLHEHGWFLMPSAGARKFFALAASLGEVIDQTDVVVKPESRSLLTSCKSLDFHTDHSKADYIAWLCMKPAKEGGESILADARKAFSLLDSDQQKILETVMLKEHRVFKNDPLQFPLISNINGKPKFYYSFWLADKNMPEHQRHAFSAFRRAVAGIPYHELKLRHNDVLIINNSFVLHGRRAIKDPSRRLRRLWIHSSFTITGETHAKY